jgi:pyruvate dehydrogenase E2 component (dihydrolipoamide acetyltransferase)
MTHLKVHAHFAGIGWLALTSMGLTYKLLPLELGVGNVPQRWGLAASVLMNLVFWGVFFGYAYDRPALLAGSAILGVAGLVCHTMQVRTIARARPSASPWFHGPLSLWGRGRVRGMPWRRETILTPALSQGGREGDGKVRASPMARHVAAEHGLDLSRISGSGPLGRVVRADVEAALASGQPQAPSAQPTAVSADGGQPATAAAPTPGADDERVPLSQMRRTIARRMAESTRTVPHFFLTLSIDATELVALRRQLVEQLESEGIKPSINDLVVKAAALALRKLPDVNVSFAEDALIRHHRVHIGIAVATERGLIVPVLRDPDRKSIGQLASEARDLADRSHAGKLQSNEYTGGTFTVSNLGMFGVEQFNAVINPPEAAILAVGAIAREPAEHQGQIVLRDRMQLTLSVDHRATDGATGARYLQELKRLLEKPLLLLV